MKKFFILILVFFFLTACGGSEDKSDQIADKYKSAAYISIDAYVTAEFSDRADKYRVLYEYKKGSPAYIRVLEPESIAGIEVLVEEDGARFSFKDTILETGISDLEHPSPMNAIHKLVHAWSFYEVSQVGREKENILLVYEDENYEYRTLFSGDCVPISGEILSDSVLILKIDFINCEA